MNNKALQVARWEFMEKVKSKAFIISLVLMPVIMIGFGVLPTLLAMKEDEKPITVGIIDETGSVVAPLAEKLDEKYKLSKNQPNYIIRNLSGAEGVLPTKSEANRLVSNGTVEGYFIIPSTVFDSGKVEYRAENVSNIKLQERFSRTIEEVVMEKRFRDMKIDASLMKKLVADVNIKSIKLTSKGEEKESGFLETFFSAYILIMMMMFLVLTSGQLLIRSVVEEKSNRVIEVLLSSCSARELMTGKILGLSGLGILQVMIWGLIGLGVSMKFQGAMSFAPENLLLSIVYFVLGYLFYSAIFVAVGSPVTTEQEAQQATTYVSLCLVLPIVIAFPVMQNPDSMMVKVLSYIPLLTPTLMVLRIAIQMPPLWEILATISLLVVSSMVMMWAAGKIFRTAILVYGKRPTIPELIRWVRAT
ncbi:MAG TPA: ABC transporter permease [Bacteroidota bacterium]